MKFTPEELIDLVERASTLTERHEWLSRQTSKGPTTPISPADAATVAGRLQRWCHVTAKGDEALFEQRLALAGLDRESARQLVAGVSLSEQPIPSWVQVLNEVLDAKNDDLDGVKRSLKVEEPVAFEEAFLPFLAIAQKKLIEQAGEAYTHLSTAAHIKLERALLMRLVHACFRTLEQEFSLFRARRQSDLDRLLSQLRGTPSNAQYQAFIQALLHGGWHEFFQKYPVLARLTAIALEFWLEATCEFLQRLTTDWGSLQATFSSNADLGRVSNLHPALSDPHYHGRWVIGLEFALGVKLVYKPRNIGLEAAYFRLLDWLNQTDPTASSFKVLKTLDCATHGWVEYVPYEVCQTPQAVQEYYRHSGRLLSVIYALRGTDIHYDNLIVSNNQPVVVDLEMLLHPPSRASNFPPFVSEAQRLGLLKADDSVLKTLILPRTFLLGGQLLEVGALGETEKQTVTAQTFDHINTDSMAWVQQTSTLPELTNSPFASEVSGSLADYTDEVIKGFTQVYRLLMQRRVELLAADGPLTGFAHQPGGRYIHRNTTTYAVILNQALQPQSVSNGADFSIELDLCSRSTTMTLWTTEARALIAEERRSLECMDLPHFTLDTSQCELKTEGRTVIASFFEQSGYTSTLERIHSLNEIDLALQIELIRYSTQAKELHHDYEYEPTVSSVDALVSSNPAQEKQGLNLSLASITQRYEQQAMSLAEEIERRAVVGRDGSVGWLGLRQHFQTKQLLYQPFEANLYGNCGIALFLAALDRVTHQSRWRSLIWGVLTPLQQQLRQFSSEDRTMIAASAGIGGSMGVGSVIYALTVLGQLLNEPVLFEDATLAASCLTPEVIASDRQFGVFQGAAGTLLALLALHRTTADSTALELANHCGGHLLSHAAPYDGKQVWLSSTGEPLLGFANGTAGIAHALNQLFAATGHSQFLSVAKRAIATEATLLSQALEHRPTGQTGLEPESTVHPIPMGWANGVPGIALAKLKIDPNSDAEMLEQMLSMTQHCALSAVDYIYSGNFGCLEPLLIAAQSLRRPEFLNHVYQSADQRIAKATANGKFQFSPRRCAPLYNPNFFYGTAGIGYQLLRFAHPEILPSILLWESEIK